LLLADLKVPTYAGIGARKTPPEVLAIMARISQQLYAMGWHLRSGGAKGADTAFAQGLPTDGKTIFLPRDATKDAIELAASFHPAWHKCSDYARQCHGRNMMILLGRQLSSPAQKVICWTADGKPTGGTGQAIRAAEAYGIPVSNLGDKATIGKCLAWLI
jgi:hypothetical protein